MKFLLVYYVIGLFSGGVVGISFLDIVTLTFDFFLDHMSRENWSHVKGGLVTYQVYI